MTATEPDGNRSLPSERGRRLPAMGNVDHLALVLAGSGYGPDGPVLAVPSLALSQRGALVEVVPYPDRRPSLEEAEMAEFAGVVERSVAALLDRHRPRRVTFVAK